MDPRLMSTNTSKGRLRLTTGQPREGDRARRATLAARRRGLSAMSILLLALLLPAAGSLPADKTLSLSTGDSHQGPPFVEEPEAKSLLGKKRVKRGWSINSLNLLWEMEEQQRRGAAKAHELELHLAKVCPHTCWGRFGPWSSCSVHCGTTGVQYAHRNITPSGECVAWVKEHGCPGSSMVGRPCNRKCHNGGTLQARDCACPDAYNGTCCEAVVSCGDPGAPPYGYLKNFDFLYDSVAQYQCSYGYQMYGEPTRHCQADGSWTGSLPICSVVTCSRPTRLDNGWIELRNGSGFGSEAVYACVTGYFLQGHRKRMCQHTGMWSGPEPHCVSIFCPPPPEPEGGMLRLPGAKLDRTPYGGVAIYSCNFTHSIRGDRIRRCDGPGPIGIWSGQEPKCIEKTRCPSPKSMSVNSELRCSADVETGGEVCNIVCERGYARPNDEHEYIKCNEDTDWQWARPNNSLPLSSCIEVLTPQISLQAESPYSVKNCAALRPQERSLLRAEFSHILAVHDICMQSMPGHDGCHVTQVESHCSDWLVQDVASSLPAATVTSSASSSRGSGLVSRELIMTFNLTIGSTSLRDLDCRQFCPNVSSTSKVCDTTMCLEGYVMGSVSLLIENVGKLKDITKQGDEEPNSREILVSDKPTMAAGRYILFAKDAIKISDVTFKCDPSTSVSRKYCEKPRG